ncbi:MAG TPA: type VII secretion protein EccCa [Pseudonocardia sp.]|nr:type VII secretion protein EccCa [Pseudonocardia sp.]
MSTVRLRRPARAPLPVVPADEVVLQPPPELARGNLGNVWFTALPALAGLGSVAYLLAGPPNPITYIAGSFFLVSAIAMVVGSLLSARSQTRNETQQQRWDFLRHLSRTRDRVRRTAAAQRERELWGGPPPDALWSVVASPRLWERRPGDDDFGAVRIGVGSRQLATALVPAESGPVEDLDPLSATALRRFITTHRAVPDLPLKVLLRRFAALGFRSAPERPEGARGLVRALLCQAAVFHAPTDLIIMICTRRPDHPYWSWVKWLPHAQHPSEVDYAGPVRLIDPSLQACEDLLGAELTRRSGFNPHVPPAADMPHVVIVLDGATVAGTELAVDPEGLQGVTVLDLDGAARETIRDGGILLEVDEAGRLLAGAGAQREPLGRADELSIEAAEALARQLAGFRLATGADAEDLSTVDATLPALLGSPDAAALDLERLWRPRPLRDRLRAPIGISADGGVLELDIKEAAQDGMGPHGLLIGATGSGKSELLRTMVLGLAAMHPPDVLNMVLVDFKGGATFAGMSRLGHVAAVITNLQDDAGLVSRMYEALSGELNRRQELLRAAGSLVSVRDYERARQRGVPLDPLPNLLVVVDEFSELIAQQEEFVELFVQIGRLGRSLGLHLLLASQRLDEGKIRGLEAHLSYRIALRTFSPEESRTVIGVPDAYTLPSAPGHGLLKADTAVLTRFRTTYVSGGYADGIEGGDGTLPGPVGVRPFPARMLAVPAGVAAATAPAAAPAEEDPTQPTMLSVMVDQIAARGGVAHQVWLPPLEEPAPLDALLGGLAVRPGRGFGASPDTPELQVPIGHVDLPYQQRRDPLLIDLSGAGGHVGVVGRPRSGKSTMLRTLVAALALRHTPAEVQFYCLDFSGALQALAGLPHVGGVAGRQDPDVVRRLVAEVATVLEDRERRFRELGVDSMASYRQLRADGRAADDPFGDVFLVVDGWSVLRGEFEEQEERIIALAARSLTFGVHLLLATNRWMDLRLGLRDILGTKTELRIGDPIDSEIDRKLAAAVPDRPGRGIGPRKAHHLVGVPRVDGQHSTDGLAAGLAELVARVADAWDGPVAPRVRLLPRLVELEELLPVGANGAGANGRRELVIGLEGDRLGTVRLDQRAEPGLLLVGDQETGKTATLRAIARQVVETNTDREAKVVIIDYRRGMLGEFDGPSQLAYVGSGAQLDMVVSELVIGFERRLPGPDVTPAQLRSRSWWQGPDIHLIVDDYELVATAAHPLLPLLPFLAQARDVGLHLYVARRAGGASRALLDPVLSAMRELNFPAVLMSAPRDEMQIFGLRPAPLPPGRGILVHRRLGTVPIQLARQDSVTTG